MHLRRQPNAFDRATNHLPTPPTRGRRPAPRGRALLATFMAFSLASAGVFAQGDADPAEVVVAQLGDDVVTLEAFDLRFEAAVRSTLVQQGVAPEDVNPADFDAARPSFLDQVAQELVLSDHAARLGLAASAEEVDAVMDEIREEYGDRFDAFLAEIGFASASDLAAAVRRSLNAERVVETIRATAVVADADVEAWYQANPELVGGPDGPQPLEAVSDQIAAVLASEFIQAEIAALVADSDIELFPERL
jgi:hypothetical protein